LVLEEGGPRFEPNYPDPSPDGEALIRLSIGGICATDLELVAGYMDFEGVLGHEWVGVVEASPDPDWIGARVVGDINCPCRRCATCIAGRSNHCPHRSVLGILGRDGVFADQLRLPLDCLHRVPDAVTDEAAVFVEPLAAACRILQQIAVRATDRVLVLGVGRLGQLCARVLALTGAEVYASSRNPARLAMLPNNIEPLGERGWGAERFDIVVDCTGSVAGLELATGAVRPGGTIVLKTTVHEGKAPNPTPWVVDEITVVGSRCGPFPEALEYLEEGLVDPTPLITARFPLESGVLALATAAEREHVKVLLDPSLEESA
jgi:alcohol dehydrogenase